VIDRAELARRSILGFGEIAIALGSGGAGTTVRRPDAVGSRIDSAADNPWFSAAVVPLGMTPPLDDQALPHCLWTVEERVDGRVEDLDITTPCLGLDLSKFNDLNSDLDDDLNDEQRSASLIETPSLAIVGELNERAYGDSGTFGPLIEAVIDTRIRTYGLRDDGHFVCVALTIDIDDDLGIHYVATEEAHQRRGLASRLVRSILTEAQHRGMVTSTLQASADGLPAWKKLGFQEVALLRGFVRLTHQRLDQKVS
jgi:GNAT superfamily N-acetyltransferase